MDTDNDGKTDCADDDCAVVCETICNDGIDNDEDGAVDCVDADCIGNPACVEANCTDGVDNDSDGKLTVSIPIAPPLLRVRVATWVSNVRKVPSAVPAYAIQERAASKTGCGVLEGARARCV